jgi:hypothetical protein
MNFTVFTIFFIRVICGKKGYTETMKDDARGRYRTHSYMTEGDQVPLYADAPVDNITESAVMFLLKNDCMWCDLESHVLKIDALLEEVGQECVTGFIEFIFPDFSAVILLDEGNIIQCVKIEDGKVYPVRNSEILMYLEEMGATVGLYRLKKEIVLAMCRIITSIPVAEPVSTQNVDAKELLRALEADDFSGVVTVRAERGECSVILEHGVPVCCLSRNMNGRADSVECLKEFLEIVKEDDMVMSVYRSEENCTDMRARLRKVAGEVLGEPVEEIEEMLEGSGKSKEELLKTGEKITAYTCLLFDKEKANMLSQRLNQVIENGFSQDKNRLISEDGVGKKLSKVEDEKQADDGVPWFLQVACSSFYRQ